MSINTLSLRHKSIYGQTENIMNDKQKFDANKLLQFGNKKIMTKTGLVKMFHCSGRTIQRKLKEWKAIRSYNKNGQYYALESVAEFNASGLWCYDSVYFSKYGNLKKTIILFVNESLNGLTASEISDKLYLEKNSFLTFFKNISGIRREKISSKYVYFSIDIFNYQKQKANRVKLNEEVRKNRLSNINIIHILTEKVKYPGFDEVAISGGLLKQGVRINPMAITELFDRLGIKKKLRVSSSG